MGFRGEFGGLEKSIQFNAQVKTQFNWLHQTALFENKY